jgi:hypothetical protein
MWTRENIREYIKRKYGMEVCLSTLGYYLARWGFSVQRPVKRAYQQDEKKIGTWLNKEFPGISERAKAEDAEIFFGDEMGVQNTANYAKGYAQIGKTPVVQVESKKMKINMLSAISKRGKLRFVLYKDNMTGDKLIDFMRRLVYRAVPWDYYRLHIWGFDSHSFTALLSVLNCHTVFVSIYITLHF